MAKIVTKQHDFIEFWQKKNFAEINNNF